MYVHRRSVWRAVEETKPSLQVCVIFCKDLEATCRRLPHVLSRAAAHKTAAGQSDLQAGLAEPSLLLAGEVLCGQRAWVSHKAHDATFLSSEPGYLLIPCWAPDSLWMCRYMLPLTSTGNCIILYLCVCVDSTLK